MQKAKIRMFNFRFIFFCAVFLFLGIYFAPNLLNINYRFIVIFFVIFGVIIFLGLKYKKPKYILALSLAFIVGFASFVISINTYGNNYISSDYVTVVGRVKNCTDDIILDNVKVDGKKIGKLLVSGNINCSVGDKVEFSAKVSPVNLFLFGKFNSFYYRQKITHSCYTSSAEVTQGSPNFLESFRLKVKERIKKGMNEDDASVAYASLFGDTSEIDKSIVQNFRYTGISHLLAVSGLHIGFMSAIFIWLLNLTKLKKKFCFIILFSVLFLYCFLCSFTPSVTRATLMCLILYASVSVFSRQTDRLNSLGISAIIILIINPLSAFDIGFQLSFACVISIFFFAGKFSKIFNKLKIPKFLSFSLSVSLATQIGILPISIGVFGQIPTISIFANILCIPIFQMAYTLTLTLMPFVLIFPLLTNLLFLPSLFYRCVLFIANYLSDFKVLKIYFSSISICIGFYLLLFIFSKYYKNKKKFIISSFVIFLSIIFSLFFLIKPNYNNQVFCTYKTCVIADNKGDLTVFVLDDSSYYLTYLMSHIEKNKINNLICKNNNILNDIKMNFEINNYYFYDNIINFNSNNINVSTISLTNEILGFKVEVGNKIMFIGLKSFSFFDEQEIETDALVYDFAIACSVTQNEWFSSAIDNKVQSAYKNFTFLFQNDKVVLRKIF